MHLTWEKTSSFLMGIACILVFLIFKKYLKKKRRSNFSFYVPVNESILNIRNKIIEKKVTYDIKMTVLNQEQFFVDLQLQFKFNKNRKIDAKYLFLDFYNFPQQFQAEINGIEFKPKILHGRIYLQKKLLKLNDTNNLTFSYLSRFPKNHYCYVNDNDQIINIFQKSQCIFSILFPCFQMRELKVSIFLTMKISLNLNVLHNGELIDETHFKKLKILQYFLIDSNYEEFILIIKKDQFQFCQTYTRKSLKVFVEKQHFLMLKNQTQQELFESLNFHHKKIQSFLWKEFDFQYENTPEIQIYILNPMKNIQYRSQCSQNKIFIIHNDYCDIQDIKIELVFLLFLYFFNIFNLKTEQEEYETLQRDSYYFHLNSLFYLCQYIKQNLLDMDSNLKWKFYFGCILNQDYINDIMDIIEQKFKHNFQYFDFQIFQKEKLMWRIFYEQFQGSFCKENLFGYALTQKNQTFHLQVINGNYNKNLKNIFFLNIGYQVDQCKKFPFHFFMDIKINSSEEMLCFLSYVEQQNVFEVEDLYYFVIILRNHSKLLKNNLVLKSIKTILIKHFFSQMLWKKRIKYLRVIFVENNYLQDEELKNEFKKFFDIWDFKKNIKWERWLERYLKFYYDFFDYFYIRNLIKD